jgi:hypothetical protein
MVKLKDLLEKKDFENISWPEDMGKKPECSLGKDEDGYFVYTHRARSNSYDTPQQIPKSKIEFIESTG